MTSFVYTEMEKLNPRTVLHERETTSSGRPKAQSLQQDDQFFWYEYDQRGGLRSKNPKTPIQSYAHWHRNNVVFQNGRRITPLTEFEKRMGVSMSEKPIKTVWYNGRKFSDAEWEIYHKLHDIDYGNVGYSYSSDLPTGSGQGASSYADFTAYFTQKAKERDLIVVGSIQQLNFKEKPNPAIIEKVRPNPKEESIASVKIEKPEPIKEIVKYSPLMIAGVIAVVVVLFLKRRA